MRFVRTRNQTLIAIALMLITVLGIEPTLAAQQFSTEKRTQIEAAVSKFMATSHAPGVSVAVVENGALAWSTGFGMADLENSVPATEHTLYRLASISKSLTAIGAMQLVEHGKLDLDASVQKYCPAFPQKDITITTREVLGHLGGIRHYREGPNDLEIGNTKHFDKPIEAGLNFFKDDPLVAKPGTEFHYSTQGFTLVGCVMEGASGKSYVDYMREQVFSPAEMAVTQPDQRFSIIPYRTRFYQLNKSGTVENADFLDSSYKIPGGGFISSVEDMARLEVAILHDKLIRRPTRDLLWTPLKPSNGGEDNYGLGWDTGKVDSVFYAGHNGGQQGTSTAFRIAPAQQAGVVVLTNLEGADAGGLAMDILKIMTNTSTESPSSQP
ncbi:MAG TPA: serine hydrolase domain-containing protein [Terriglobales bacterium]|nr:serine hydrolase domain-containing protein [Terriglobales bacterium]